VWENGFRANVEANQGLARHGMSTLLPDTRVAITARNQALQAMPLLVRVGVGLGGRIERPPAATLCPTTDLTNGSAALRVPSTPSVKGDGP